MQWTHEESGHGQVSMFTVFHTGCRGVSSVVATGPAASVGAERRAYVIPRSVPFWYGRSCMNRYELAAISQPTTALQTHKSVHIFPQHPKCNPNMLHSMITNSVQSVTVSTHKNSIARTEYIAEFHALKVNVQKIPCVYRREKAT